MGRFAGIYQSLGYLLMLSVLIPTVIGLWLVAGIMSLYMVLHMRYTKTGLYQNQNPCPDLPYDGV